MKNQKEADDEFEKQFLEKFNFHKKTFIDVQPKEHFKIMKANNETIRIESFVDNFIDQVVRTEHIEKNINGFSFDFAKYIQSYVFREQFVGYKEVVDIQNPFAELVKNYNLAYANDLDIEIGLLFERAQKAEFKARRLQVNSTYTTKVIFQQEFMENIFRYRQKGEILLQLDHNVA